MIYSSLITGVILILAGLLVKNNPDLLAGYNTLSNEEKEKIDTDKLTHIARKYLVLTGLSVLIIGVGLSFVNVPEKIHLYVVCGIVLLGVTALIIESNRLEPKN
ncbi:MAG: DUF3784 domain-containing protein [Flavobacteriaceae bacterium]|jgi:uncharacterized membrane protein|nr:DUF3784 domain-containing protein [Formosa sp.]MDG1374206.1 DUF3784 domain-containing protein [Flavobacteriaceae bacterium]MDG2499528.1 DUF3784 domain-containing protein [Flavobacteriaceae bacterium]